MNTMRIAMSSLLVAMFLAASLPVSAQMRERGSSASQRPQQQQQPRVQQQQQPRVQQGAQQGNATRGDSRQAQHSSPAVRGEQDKRQQGRLTQEERRELHRDLNRANREIYRR